MASALLASDLNNPDYAGATNPDSRLAVLFFSHTMQNEYETVQQGRPIFFDCDFITIFVPGDTTSVVSRPVHEDDKRRFPLHWAHYQNKHSGDQREIGTPLTEWSRLRPSQIEELRALKFYTVEAVASAADSQLQRIGMVAGMSPYAFRDAAIRYLALAKDDSAMANTEARAKALEEDSKKKDAAIAEMQAEMAVLRKIVAESVSTKGKPGPKPKEKLPQQIAGGTL